MIVPKVHPEIASGNLSKVSLDNSHGRFSANSSDILPEVYFHKSIRNFRQTFFQQFLQQDIFSSNMPSRNFRIVARTLPELLQKTLPLILPWVIPGTLAQDSLEILLKHSPGISSESFAELFFKLSPEFSSKVDAGIFPVHPSRIFRKVSRAVLSEISLIILEKSPMEIL